jgi:small subunit ribosomal protein S2
MAENATQDATTEEAPKVEQVVEAVVEQAAENVTQEAAAEEVVAEEAPVKRDIPSHEMEAPAPTVVDPEILQALEDGDKPVHTVDIKLLLEAGVHFGHQTKRWNPKMARYIFGKRNDIHIIDLQKTLKGLRRAVKFLTEVVRRGGKVLFVSTKRQAQEIVARAARKCDQHWVTERWLGGMLTNFETIKKRIKHLKHLKKMQEDGILDALGKKESSRLKKQLARLEKYLGGIEEMKGLPEAIFVVDPRREVIAIKEARKLKIKLVGVVDTNCDPDEIDFVIPGNDDAIRAIKLLTNYISTSLSEAGRERQQAAAKAAAEEKARVEAKVEAKAKAPRAKKPAKAEKTEKTAKAEKPAKAEKTEKVAKAEKPAKVAKEEKPAKAAKEEKPAEVAKEEAPAEVVAAAEEAKPADEAKPSA